MTIGPEPEGACRVARRLLAACILAALAAGGVSSAAAEEGSSEAAARALFDEADGAFRDGQLGRARELLERSLELYPHRATAFNLALVLQRAGASTEAVEVLEQTLAGRFGELDAAQVREGEALLRQARSDLATIEVRVVGVEGATVRVDGEVVGATPERGVIDQVVDAGRHSVSASAPFHDPGESTVEVGRGERATVTLSPTPHGATLVLTSDPGVALEVPPFGAGTGELRLELPPGTYVARALRGGGVSEREVALHPGRTTTLRLPPPAPALSRHPAIWVSVGLVVAAAVAVGLWLGLSQEPEPDVRWRVEALGGP